MLADWEQLRAAARRMRMTRCSRAWGLEVFDLRGPLLAPLAANLRTGQPDVEVEVIEASPARCLDLLIAERIDLAVIVAMQAGHGMDEDGRFELVSLLDDPLDVGGSRFASGGWAAICEARGACRGAVDYRCAGFRVPRIVRVAFTAIGYTPKIAH